MALFEGINQKVTTKAPDYMMMGAAGVIKYGEERLFASIPAVGNGTLKSAAIKAVVGVAAKEFLGGFWGNAMALGFTTDAVEDALFATVGANPSISGSGLLGTGTTAATGNMVLSGAI